MLTRIDSFLLDKAQKFCDKFQRLTGRTKFLLEKWSLVVVAVSYWMFVIEAVSLPLVLMAGLHSSHCFFMARMTEYEEKTFLAHGELKYNANYDSSTRIGALLFFGTLLSFSLWLFLVLPAPEFSWFCVWIISLLVRMYFSACVPRPPSKSKMREWLENGLKRINSFLPEPSPVPI